MAPLLGALCENCMGCGVLFPIPFTADRSPLTVLPHSPAQVALQRQVLKPLMNANEREFRRARPMGLPEGTSPSSNGHPRPVVAAFFRLRWDLKDCEGGCSKPFPTGPAASQLRRGFVREGLKGGSRQVHEVTGTKFAKGACACWGFLRALWLRPLALFARTAWVAGGLVSHTVHR